VSVSTACDDTWDVSLYGVSTARFIPPRTSVPQPPTPTPPKTFSKFFFFSKSLEDSKNLPDYKEYSKYREYRIIPSKLWR
jgi:hypothetical protein